MLQDLSAVLPFTSASRRRKIFGKLEKITTAVMIPATRSAIPSDRYTPLKPRKCVSTKQSGIRMMTFRVTARSRAERAGQ